MWKTILIAIVVTTLSCRSILAATYYVSPTGDDSSDGTSTEKPWKTCEKVNSAKFEPGDKILFQRGREWREHLQPSSDGADGSPIIYDAYGEGAKPKILGSNLLENAKFTPAGENQYAYAISDQADSALMNHVFIPSTWKAGTLTITTPTDPRTDGKIYTACLRGNVIFSNRKNHLVFCNLIADETAGQLNDGANQGYGVRIEGSTDVLVESCESNRCGRHNFAVINSSRFVGRHLRTAYVVPNMPGDNTAYVSYADSGASVAKCTSQWDDIAADHLEDGKGGTYLMFVSHGDNQGLITVENSVATTKMSFMSAPVIVKHTTLKENASIENFGVGILIDGITLLDSAAIDQWAKGGTIQNCVAHLTPTGGGPTGYGTAIVLRDKANDNIVRFNTMVTGKFSCLTVAGSNSNTKYYGNIMIAEGTTINKASGLPDETDFSFADYNFYSPTASFCGQPLVDWQGHGFDQKSVAGDPKFSNPALGKFDLKPGSPCFHIARIDAANVPPKDMANRQRSANKPSIGAYQD